MHLSKNLQELLKNLSKAGFDVVKGVFEEDEDNEHKSVKGRITYARLPELAQYDDCTHLLRPIETVKLKLYVPSNCEDAEDEFFNILQKAKASYDIEEFDEHVSSELLVHTFIVTSI